MDGMKSAFRHKCGHLQEYGVPPDDERTCRFAEVVGCSYCLITGAKIAHVTTPEQRAEIEREHFRLNPNG